MAFALGPGMHARDGREPHDFFDLEPPPRELVALRQQPKPAPPAFGRAALALLSLGLGLSLGAAFSSTVTPGLAHEARSTTEPSPARDAHAHAQSDAQFLGNRAQLYRTQLGHWPRGLEDLRRAGLIRHTMRSPWGGAYRFFVSPTRRAIVVCADRGAEPLCFQAKRWL